METPDVPDVEVGDEAVIAKAHPKPPWSDTVGVSAAPDLLYHRSPISQLKPLLTGHH